MKLARRHISKIDPLLRETLQHAGGDEIFRAVMVLGADQETVPGKNWLRRNFARAALIGER